LSGELSLLKTLPELKRPLGAAAALLELRREPVWLMEPFAIEVR
jgi:hypothetical protein